MLAVTSVRCGAQRGPVLGPIMSRVAALLCPAPTQVAGCVDEVKDMDAAGFFHVRAKAAPKPKSQ